MPPGPARPRRAGHAVATADRALPDAATVRLVAASGLFDAAWYCAAGELLAEGSDPVAHFLTAGWLAGRRPNPYFDTEWYLRENPGVARRGLNPLLHYIAAGEAEGRDPCAYFDVGWYAGQHGPEPGRTLLAHFLARRFDGAVSPLAGFDPVHYLARYPDVAAARVDPFEHYLLYGYREERDPSAAFGTAAYARAHMPDGLAENPLLHRHRVLRSEQAMLAASGLFDVAYYCAAAPPGLDARAALADFVAEGWQAGRRPNPYFETAWYLAQNPDVARSGINPLLHYLTAGEAEGRAPAPYFDLAWYAAEHAGDLAGEGATTGAGGALAHFLARCRGGAVRAVPEFDPAFYLARNPDVAAAGVDPFLHYLGFGHREGRDPSAGFDSKFYTRRYLDGDTTENPLLHWRAHRHALRLHPVPPEHDACVFEEVRRFSRPGPEFEAFQPLPDSAPRRAKLLAFYLPQYHAVPENDRWWGDGFTEWTAVARGMPRFLGQYQPRTPRDLGHYTLGTTPDDTAVLRRQIAMAQAGGVFGFVQYFYWFNRRRLLEGPLEAMLGDASLDFPFCLMWANNRTLCIS